MSRKIRLARSKFINEHYVRLAGLDNDEGTTESYLYDLRKCTISEDQGVCMMCVAVGKHTIGWNEDEHEMPIRSLKLGVEYPSARFLKTLKSFNDDRVKKDVSDMIRHKCKTRTINVQKVIERIANN